MRYLVLLFVAQVSANAIAYDNPENLKLLNEYKTWLGRGIAVKTSLLAEGCVESFGKELAEKADCVQYLQDFKKYGAYIGPLEEKVDSVKLGYFKRVEDAKTNKDYKKLEEILREKEAFEPVYYGIHEFNYDWSWHFQLKHLPESRRIREMMIEYLNSMPDIEDPDVPFSNPKYKALVKKMLNTMPRN